MAETRRWLSGTSIIQDVSFLWNKRVIISNRSRDSLRSLDQRDIINGLYYTTKSFAAHLKRIWKNVKESKYRRSFFLNLYDKSDCYVSPIWTLSRSPPDTLEYSRFSMVNLVLFDDNLPDEVVQTVSCLERIVMNTGLPLAESIATEISPLNEEQEANFTARHSQHIIHSQSQTIDSAQQHSNYRWR